MKSNAVSVSFYFSLSQSDALQNSKSVLLIQGTCLRYTAPALLRIGRSRGKWQDEDAITRDCGQNSKTRGRPRPRRPLRLRAVRLAKEAADRDAERSAAATCTKAKQSSRTAGSNLPG